MAKPNPIELQKALKGVEYPASREDLTTCAKKNHAGSAVVNGLQKLPGKKYGGPNAVSHEVFGSS